MAKLKRDKKISFYAIFLKQNNKVVSPSPLRKIFSYIDKLADHEKVYDVISKNKIHTLEHFGTYGKIQTIIMGSAKYNYRPELFNVKTAEKRENPKDLDEGDFVKTHIAVKYTEKELIVLMEERRNVLTINRFIEYLYEYSIKYFKSIGEDLPFSIDFSIILKDNFAEQLDALIRVNKGIIHINKKVIGSEFLNLSNKLIDLKEEIKIDVTSKLNRSLKGPIQDFIGNMVGGEKIIKKIRVHGFNKDGYSVMLDSDIMKRIEYATVEYNEKEGTVNTKEILSHLVNIIEGM